LEQVKGGFISGQEEHFTMESTKKCNVEWVPDKALGWKLKLSGSCTDTLEQIEGLPTRKRQYLKRRIEVQD
jgi:hypothetical protein